VNRVSLLDELEGLRGRLETMTDLLLAAAPHDLSVRARRMHLRLTESGLDPRMATAVVRRAERSATDDDDRALVAALSASIRPGGALESGLGQQVVALVGPTGVGKTTTCAKIAARLALGEGRQVALISADSFRVGAAQQLGFYGEILEVPFHTAHNRASLLAAIKRSGNAEVILVDTTGRGSVDVDGATEIAETLSADPRTQSWLVLSATSRIEDNLSALRTFARVRPSGLCLTKLDETASHGAGATVAIRSALPLRYLTDGQTVPDDLHPASPDQVARLVLEGWGPR
jgi:flagellar biosynthesis protein FlhF